MLRTIYTHVYIDVVVKVPIFGGPDVIGKVPIFGGPDLVINVPIFGGLDVVGKVPIFGSPDVVGKVPIFEGPDVLLTTVPGRPALVFLSVFWPVVSRCPYKRLTHLGIWS